METRERVNFTKKRRQRKAQTIKKSENIFENSEKLKQYSEYSENHNPQMIRTMDSYSPKPLHARRNLKRKVLDDREESGDQCPCNLISPVHIPANLHSLSLVPPRILSSHHLFPPPPLQSHSPSSFLINHPSLHLSYIGTPVDLNEVPPQWGEDFIMYRNRVRSGGGELMETDDDCQFISEKRVNTDDVVTQNLNEEP